MRKIGEVEGANGVTVPVELGHHLLTGSTLFGCGLVAVGMFITITGAWTNGLGDAIDCLQTTYEKAGWLVDK